MVFQVLSAAVLATGAVAASTLLPFAGLHDILVPGALWRARHGGETLTFDDGPDASRTPLVLDLLGKHGIRATFFVIGERAERHPSIIRRMWSEGHAIGNHGWDHASAPWLSRREIAAQLTRTQDVVTLLTGAAPTLARPPYGRRDFRYYQEARRLGLAPMMWSLDSGDWLGLPARAIASRVSRARGDDIVLFHDGNSRASGLQAALEVLLPLRKRAVRDGASTTPERGRC